MRVSIIIIFALLIMHDVSPAVNREDAADCEIARGPCSRKIGNTTVTLELNPKPVKAMEELVFAVSLEGDGDPAEVVVDLAMPGMYMGRNRVVVKKGSPGKYSGRGVIPKCPSGKRLWKATVIVPDAGEVNFFFNVIH